MTIVGAIALPLAPSASAQSFLEQLFGGPFIAEPPRPVDYSRAPAPRKAETPPATRVLIMGDSMADWLSYGLEEALSDTPEIGVVRKHRTYSGLIRYEARANAPDWAQVARELIAAERPNFIVMMVGLHDRQAIRVPPPRTPPAQKQSAERTKPEPAEAAPEAAPGVYEFRSEGWEQLYLKRIDRTIAALKSAGVPVFWVGLPPLRGTKSTSDASYLNELFRGSAEKADILYIDVWDGFVDEQGRFVTHGPDYEGQTRRLRAEDGVHFTKAGARKLAHYLEREIRRLAPAAPVALPGVEPQPQEPRGQPGGPMPRPLAGPAVPLTAFAGNNEELLGAAPARSDEAIQLAINVLVKGEAIPAPAGRADDFAWPRRGVAPFGEDPVVTITTTPIPLAQVPAPPAPPAAPSQPARPIAQPRPQPRPEPPPFFSPFSIFSIFR